GGRAVIRLSRDPTRRMWWPSDGPHDNLGGSAVASGARLSIRLPDLTRGCSQRRTSPRTNARNERAARTPRTLTGPLGKVASVDDERITIHLDRRSSGAREGHIERAVGFRGRSTVQ